MNAFHTSKTEWKDNIPLPTIVPDIQEQTDKKQGAIALK